MALPQAQGLYDPSNEHDACGVGFVAHIKGARSHSIVQQGLQILLNLDHRGATGADELFGDGAGILIQIPDAFYRAEMARQGVTLPPPGEYGVGMIFLPKESASRLACEQELERTVGKRRRTRAAAGKRQDDQRLLVADVHAARLEAVSHAGVRLLDRRIDGAGGAAREDDSANQRGHRSET